MLTHLSYLNLIRYNLKYNYSVSLLDLVFSNLFNINVFNENHTLPPLDSMHHPALTIELLYKSVTYLEYNEQMYDFVSCDYNSMKSNLASLDWNDIINSLDINDAVNVFYKNVFKIINTYYSVKILYFLKHPH